MEEHIIWDSSPDFDDWEDDLREEYPDASEEELVNIMYETNNDYLDDERANLRDIEVPNGIFAVAELGRCPPPSSRSGADSGTGCAG